MTPSPPVDCPDGRPAVTAPDSSVEAISPSTYRLAAAAVVVAAVGFVLYRAWVSDDAFITFRHVANFLAGYGPVFNPGERVQGFSHPLWFLLLAAGGLLFDVYGVAVALGLLLTAALFGVQAWLLRNERHGLLRLQFLALMLLSSKTFVEFQTSGLEPSLVSALMGSLWALLAARGLAGRQPPLTAASWLCGLLVLTRPDLIVLAGPIVLYILAHLLLKRSAPASADSQQSKAEYTPKGRWRWLGPVSALLPVLGWYGFATVYYATPLPNTAYAKVTMTFSTAVPMGLHYVMDYARCEPVHAMLVLVAMVGGLVYAAWGWLHGRRGSGVVGWLALGIACHLIYVVSIGGDFMRGRFIDPALTASAVLACWLLGQVLPREVISPSRVTAAIGLVGAAFLLVQVRSPAALSCIARGADELLYGLMRWPTPMIIGLVGYSACSIYLLRRIAQRDGRAAELIYAALVLVEALLLLGLIGFCQPAWAVVGVLAGAGLCIAMCCAVGFAGRGLRHQGAYPVICVVIAAAAALCDVGRPREYGDGVISDDYSFYWIGKWHNPFRHPTGALRGSAGSWLRFGTAAHRYAEEFGPITVACDSLGITSYYAGPRVRVIDLYGLTDPYLARSDSPPRGRPGHIRFRIPPGYLESRGTVSLLPDWIERLSRMDPQLAADARQLAASAVWADAADEKRWRETQRIISGPLFERERFSAFPRYIWPKRSYLADSPDSDPIRARVTPQLSAIPTRGPLEILKDPG